MNDTDELSRIKESIKSLAGGIIDQQKETKKLQEFLAEMMRKIDGMAHRQDVLWNMDMKSVYGPLPRPDELLSKRNPVWWYEVRNEIDENFKKFTYLELRIADLEKHCFGAAENLTERKEPPKLTLVAADGEKLTEDKRKD